MNSRSVLELASSSGPRPARPRWHNYAHQLSHGARRIATSLVEPKLKDFKAIATNLLNNDEYAVETGFDGVVRKAKLVGESIHADECG